MFEHRLSLTNLQVDVWMLAYDSHLSPSLEQRYRALLSPEERARNQRFVVEGARRQHLLGRALVRTTLSRYQDVSPGEWRFEAGSHGRPRIAAGLGASGLDFNLSHTEGLVALAVSRDRPCGIDVEDATMPRGELRELASDFFSPSEAADVEAVPDDGLTDRFLTFWTLKESYIKAVGKGLSIPLERFSFAPAPDAITLRVSPPIDDEPSRWRFQQRRPTARHHMALAVRAGPEEQILVTTRHAVPFGSERHLERRDLPPGGHLSGRPLMYGGPRSG